MFKFKKLVVVGAVVLTIGAVSGTAMAASIYSNPAEAAADLTGQSIETVIAERQEGTTYGAIADEAGVLDEFKDAMLELKKDVLDERVAAGDMTQAEADEIIAAIEEHMEDCDGTGGAGIGRLYGAGFGSGGQGLGQGLGSAQGGGYGGGQNGQRGGGMRLQDGSCAV